MNMQVRNTAKTKRLDTKRAVEWVVLELPLCEPLDDTPQKILDAFEALLKKCTSPRTNQIAERIGMSNESNVRGHLQDLVSSGYIGAYRKKKRLEMVRPRNSSANDPKRPQHQA